MARDVDEAAFATAVLERSKEVPVVADFWAAWCGPCRFLTPLLERTAALYDGSIELVKIDVDANPRLSAEHGIQGIPAVKAFRDSLVVSEFVGAQPEPAVRDFFDALMAAERRRDERDRALSDARAAAERGDLAGARRLAGPLAPDPEAERILSDVALAEAGISLDEPEEVLSALLERVRSGDREKARTHMVRIFEVLGDGHPLVRRYRPLLARVLF